MTEAVKYEFSPDEIKILAEDTAQALAELAIARERKKAAMRMHSEAIAAIETRIFSNAKKHREGYEMREAECIVVMDQPRAGMKSVVVGATSEVIRIEPMTPEERQANLFNHDPDEERMS